MVHISNAHAVCVGGVWVCAWMRISVHVCLSSHLYRVLCSIHSGSLLIFIFIFFSLLYTNVHFAEIDFMIKSFISLF